MDGWAKLLALIKAGQQCCAWGLPPVVWVGFAMENSSARSGCHCPPFNPSLRVTGNKWTPGCIFNNTHSSSLYFPSLPQAVSPGKGRERSKCTFPPCLEIIGLQSLHPGPKVALWWVQPRAWIWACWQMQKFQHLTHPRPWQAPNQAVMR